MEITKTIATELIGKSKGNIFSARFTKADGSKRDMTCRLGVKKYLQGGELKYDAQERGNVIVFDMANKGYRTIKIDRLEELTLNGVKYNVI